MLETFSYQILVSKFRWASLLSAVLLVGCTTYQSNFEMDSKRPLEAYDGFFIDPKSKQNQVVDEVLTRTFEDVGFQKRGFFDLKNMDRTSESATLKVWWDVTEVTSRVGGGGYSQEITLVMRDLISDEPVYIGTGEYMGLTDADDLRGAMIATLSGVQAYAGFNKHLATQILMARSEKIEAEKPTEKSRMPETAGEKQKRHSAGTCFVVASDGRILTSHHIIDGLKKIVVTLSDGRQLDARVLEISSQTDLALLQVSAIELPYIPLSSIRSVEIGMEVFTLGFPVKGLLGPEPKFTDGVVSSLSGILGESSLLQVTVPIQPGSSGGPLVSDSGDVVGVVTSTAAVETFFSLTGSLPQNVNWAVKSDYARLLIDNPPAMESTVNRKDAIKRALDALCQIEST